MVWIRRWSYELGWKTAQGPPLHGKERNDGKGFELRPSL